LHHRDGRSPTLECNPAGVTMAVKANFIIGFYLQRRDSYCGRNESERRN
jgi:hypothetical protein